MTRQCLSPLAKATLEHARSRLGFVPVQKHHIWSEAEERMLIARYPNETTQALADEIGLSVYQVYAKAKRLGISKSAEFLSSNLCGRFDGSSGTDHRFAKGMTPWNKAVVRAGLHKIGFTCSLRRVRERSIANTLPTTTLYRAGPSSSWAKVFRQSSLHTRIPHCFTNWWQHAVSM